MNPPREAKDLLKVDMIRSISASLQMSGRASAPSEHAHGVGVIHHHGRVLLAHEIISGRGAISPSMLKSPSTTTSLPAFSGDF